MVKAVFAESGIRNTCEAHVRGVSLSLYESYWPFPISGN